MQTVEQIVQVSLGLVAGSCAEQPEHKTSWFPASPPQALFVLSSGKDALKSASSVVHRHPTASPVILLDIVLTLFICFLLLSTLQATPKLPARSCDTAHPFIPLSVLQDGAAQQSQQQPLQPTGPEDEPMGEAAGERVWLHAVHHGCMLCTMVACCAPLALSMVLL